MSYAELTSPETRRALGELTFATTTDGNHGRGVAWTARMMGQRAVVYMPRGSAPFRLEAIRAEGAEARIVDLNYDESVRKTAEDAKRNGWVVVQDTAWEGYEDIPLWIMQGYGTMVQETALQLERAASPPPTHVLIQAGVGSLAGMVQAAMVARYGSEAPKVLVCEPEGAACYYESARIGDGRPHAVTGSLATLMAGLACGEPNILGYRILRDYAEAFLRCPDYVAARAMRILAIPLKGDPRVISGESGAVTAGALSFIMRDHRLAEFRERVGLDGSARVLLFSTEGNTDPERYRSVVWEGEYPTLGLVEA
jgi:diaminopropionate ammonia-lyase